MSNFLPPIGLTHHYYLGDTVLLSGIAEGLYRQLNTDIYVVSNYPEILDNHPYLKSVGWDNYGSLPKNIRIIDMNQTVRSIKDEVQKNGIEKNVILENKLQRMYDAVAVGQRFQPTLYLTNEEKKLAELFKEAHGGRMIGIAISTHSGHEFKKWAYFDLLLKDLSKRHNLFIISDNKAKCLGFDLPVTYLINLPMRELMYKISTMDLVIGNDTGISHLSSALNVPTVVIGFKIWQELYDDYPRTFYLSSNVNNMQNVSVRQVKKISKKVMGNIILVKKRKMALMLLEGIGGTITLSDHAEKIFTKYGEKPYLIIRKNKVLFDGNPNVAGVIEVGTTMYQDIIPDVIKEWERVAIIKTGIGKLYGIKQDFSKWEEMYENHPIGLNELEKYKLNMTQMADKTMGLPYNDIRTKMFRYDEPKIELPNKYIVISNGVDTWHRGLRQTKSWLDEYWQEFIDECGENVIHVGTDYDNELEKVIDLRGRTTIPELAYILRNAIAIVCTEGGLMHLGYAVGNKNTIVLKGPTSGYFYGYKELHNIESKVCNPCYWETSTWYKDCPDSLGAVCMETITPSRVLLKLREVLYENMVEDAQHSPMLMDSSMAVS